MFVRFRVVRHCLVVNLVASRRVGGKVVNEHIARLGSAALPEPISAAERILFWQELRERWRDLINRLGNRVADDDRKKVLAAIHCRIPKPTEGEKQQARIAAARGLIASDEAFRAMFSNRIERNQAFIAELEAKIAEDNAILAKTASVQNSWQLVRLLAGERVEGDDEAMLDHIVHVANKRDAAIRAAPRPAARGERGPQKRPRWMRRSPHPQP
jgi:hypothetical protein